MTGGLILLDAASVRAALPLPDALESQRLAFTALGRGEVAASGKLLLEDSPDSTLFCYVARLDGGSPAVCKIGSVNPGNAAAGLPAVSATVLALDPATGDVAGRLRGLGELVLDPPAVPPPGLVFFNSVGLGVQDAAAAAMVLRRLDGTPPGRGPAAG